MNVMTKKDDGHIVQDNSVKSRFVKKMIQTYNMQSIDASILYGIFIESLIETILEKKQLRLDYFGTFKLKQGKKKDITISLVKDIRDELDLEKSLEHIENKFKQVKEVQVSKEELDEYNKIKELVNASKE